MESGFEGKQEWKQGDQCAEKGVVVQVGSEGLSSSESRGGGEKGPPLPGSPSAPLGGGPQQSVETP